MGDTAFRTRPHAKPRNHALDDSTALTFDSAPPLRKRRRRSALPAHSKTPTDHFGLRWQAQRDTAFERGVTTERV